MGPKAAEQDMPLSISPLSRHIGAEATGVDLTSLSNDEARDLNAAFSERSVLAVRGQDLAPEQLLSASGVFGRVFEQHNKKFALPECPKVHYISNQDRYPDGRRYIPGEGYHTDHSNAEEPPKATLLHAIKLPSSGGDTQFVDMSRAYEGLDADVKRRIDRLRAVHVYQSRHSERKLMGITPGAGAGGTIPKQVSHPLVRVHPETGRRSLYINPIRIDSIIGMDDTEALPLLGDLLAHAVQEKYQYRHAWRVGDFVMWDNRCLMHKANGDYDHAEERYLYRMMLEGDAPRGADTASDI
jgi:taurine dioxygenase